MAETGKIIALARAVSGNGAKVAAQYSAGNYIKGKTDTFNAFARRGTGLCDTFAFITDMHWTLNAKNSPELLKFVQENTNIDKFFCGGDVCDFVDGEGQPFDAFREFQRALGNTPIYSAMGNHEYMSAYGTENRLYQSFNSVGRDRVGNMERSYFYVDNPQTKIRYIVLNGFKPGTNTWAWGYEAEQLTWLADEALNLSEGWAAIVITHMVHAIDLDTGVISIPSVNQAMLDVLDASDAEVIAVVCGHMHCDYLDKTAGGIPIVITTCDKNLPWIYQDVDKEPWLDDREIGTVKEQAIDLFMIDRAAKQLTRVRVGCPIRIGTDPSEWTEMDYQVIDYEHGPETLSFDYTIARYNHKSDGAGEDYVYNEGASGSQAYASIYTKTAGNKRIRYSSFNMYPIRFKSGATSITVTVPSGIRVTAWFTNSTVPCDYSADHPGYDGYAKVISGDSSAYDSTVPLGPRTLTIPNGADSVALSLQYPGGTITDEIMAGVTIVAS